MTLKEIMSKTERHAVLSALERNDWHRGRTAKELDIHIATLHRIINRHKLYGNGVEALQTNAGGARFGSDRLVPSSRNAAVECARSGEEVRRPALCPVDGCSKLKQSKYGGKCRAHEDRRVTVDAGDWLDSHGVT